MLQDTLSDKGIQGWPTDHPGAIQPGHAHNDSAVLADKVWHLHTHGDAFRVYSEEMPGV